MIARRRSGKPSRSMPISRTKAISRPSGDQTGLDASRVWVRRFGRWARRARAGATRMSLPVWMIVSGLLTRANAMRSAVGDQSGSVSRALRVTNRRSVPSGLRVAIWPTAPVLAPRVSANRPLAPHDGALNCRSNRGRGSSSSRSLLGRFKRVTNMEPANSDASRLPDGEKAGSPRTECEPDGENDVLAVLPGESWTPATPRHVCELPRSAAARIDEPDGHVPTQDVESLDGNQAIRARKRRLRDGTGKRQARERQSQRNRCAPNGQHRPPSIPRHASASALTRYHAAGIGVG